jgi:hypothetical protein
MSVLQKGIFHHRGHRGTQEEMMKEECGMMNKKDESETSSALFILHQSSFIISFLCDPL